jgi:hypothetical protein
VQFRDNKKEFQEQFRRDKELLHSGDIHSHQIDSLGPIWMGRGIFSSETNGSSYQNLIRLGLLGATHSNEPIDITLPGKIDRLSINYYEDMLADVKQ